MLFFSDAQGFEYLNGPLPNDSPNYEFKGLLSDTRPHSFMDGNKNSANERKYFFSVGTVATFQDQIPGPVSTEVSGSLTGGVTTTVTGAGDVLYWLANDVILLFVDLTMEEVRALSC